jgi:hypothetical protein
MKGEEWLDELGRRIGERAPDVDSSRPDPDTLTLFAGLRGVVMHDAGSAIWFSPSIAAGSTIESRLQDRVKHLDIEQYGINDATIDVALDAVLRHLKPDG